MSTLQRVMASLPRSYGLWLVLLSCGHERVVSDPRRPKQGAEVECHTCDAAESPQESEQEHEQAEG